MTARDPLTGDGVVPVRDGYDRWSATYDVDGNPFVALEEQHFDEVLGPVAGLRVLDLGCGTGRHAVRLARAGASVEAVDFSDGMLAQARRSASAGTTCTNRCRTAKPRSTASSPVWCSSTCARCRRSSRSSGACWRPAVTRSCRRSTRRCGSATCRRASPIR
jgi:hypothetical protein